jgi:hypothetical protein
VEVSDTDKHSSLPQFGINYERKKFFRPAPDFDICNFSMERNPMTLKKKKITQSFLIWI